MKTIVITLFTVLLAGTAAAQTIEVQEPPAALGLTVVPLPGNIVGVRFENTETREFIQATMKSPAPFSALDRAEQMRKSLISLSAKPDAVYGNAYEASFRWTKSVFRKMMGMASVKLYEVEGKSYLVEFYGSWAAGNNAAFAPAFTAVVRSLDIL